MPMTNVLRSVGRTFFFFSSSTGMLLTILMTDSIEVLHAVPGLWCPGGGGREQHASLKVGPRAKEVALNLKLQLKLLICLAAPTISKLGGLKNKTAQTAHTSSLCEICS